MKEIDIFESWINNVQEGTWAIPSKPQAQAQLKKLLSEPFPVGADATNATQALYGIFGDDQLFDQLGDLADSDPNADARSVILARLNDFKDNPGVANILAGVKDEADVDGQPAAPAPAGPGGEEAINAPAEEPAAAPPAEAPAPEAPAPEAGAAPAPEAPAEEPAPEEQPVQEDAEDDYDDDLDAILKRAGVGPCPCPAEDYITGKDPHIKESNDIIRMSRLLEGRSHPFTVK